MSSKASVRYSWRRLPFSNLLRYRDDGLYLNKFLTAHYYLTY